MILSNQSVHYDGAACYMKPGQVSALACTLLHTSLMCSPCHIFARNSRKFYARFIDDGLLGVDVSKTGDSSIFRRLNSWNRHIQMDAVPSSCSQHFLDLQPAPKSRDDAVPPKIEYGLYIPATQHLIHTEAVRLMRTSKRCESYNLPCCLYVRSLGPRGHSQNMIWSILQRYTFTDKAMTLSHLHRKKVGQSWELCSQDLQCQMSNLTFDDSCE